MNVYLNGITGIDDAIVSMFMSKRTWTRELEDDIRNTCKKVLDKNGFPNENQNAECLEKFNNWINSLTKWGIKHITLLRYIDLSITVEGLHRAGQDDWDAHAMRYNNRIIRSSTRLAKFGYEMSDYYKDKIIPTDKALKLLQLDVLLPDGFEHNGKKYVKCINGYIAEEYKDNKDVLRGLYMLSIPSNFIFKVNMTEWAHVYKERNKNGGANPEVKELCEAIADTIENKFKNFNREFFNNIKN